MLTLEVNGQFVSWPEDFALLMMKYYRKHGVTFVLHRNCAHTRNGNSGENKTGSFGAFEYYRGSR